MEIEKLSPPPAFNPGRETSPKPPADHCNLVRQQDFPPYRINSETKGQVMVETSDFARLEQNKIRLEQAAKAIRHNDQTLETIDGNLEKMENLLTTYTKQYPPFPPDSRQKADLVKQFNALWHLIEKLQLAPATDLPEIKPAAVPNDSAPEATSDRKAGQWLPLTPLSGETSDSQLQASLNSVKKARTMVAQQRQSLSRQAARITAGI